MQLGNTIAVAANTDGRLEGFVTRADGSLWHAWETAVGSGEWSPWRALHHEGVSDFAVARVGDALAVVALVYGAAVFARQDPAAAGGWRPWTPLGGSPLARVAIARGPAGLLEALALDADGRVQRCNQSADETWSDWAVIRSDRGATDLAFVAAAGRPTPYLVDANGVVQQNAEDTDGWRPVGVGAFFTRVAAIASANGHPDVFGHAADGTAWHLVAGAWAQLGAQKLSSLSVARNADGRLEVLGLADGHVAHAWQVADDRWSSWGSIPAPNTPLARLAVSPPDASGHLNLLGASADDQTWRAHQGDSRTGWTPWAHVAGVIH